jgi:FKBP-type peptidyl-prolyl cis-trans isomerase FklB
MQKPLTWILSCLAGLLLTGIAPAQDTTTPKPSKPATSSSQSKTSTAAKKPGTTAAKPATPGVALTTQKQKNSYALGMNVGTGMRKQGLNEKVDPAIVARGLRDALSGSKTAMTEDEMKTTIQALANEIRSAQETKAKEAGAANRKEGEAFLAANKSKEGVKTTADGLQYKIITEGNGPKPTANDTVTVNYRGTLINGKEFDSSYKRGQPATFPVGGVIKGWTEALQLMPVGSKWQLFIPADLAYGDNPRPGGDIAPGDTLIFEVELLSIGEQKK